MIFGIMMATAIIAGEDPKHVGLVPVHGTGWQARPGDEAELWGPDTPAATSVRSLEVMVKAQKANDRVGLDQYVKGGGAYLLADRTKILVIKVHLRPVDSTPISIEQYLSELQGSAGREKPLEPVEVRVIDGPLKDKLVMVPVESVALLGFPPRDPVAEQAARREEKAARDREQREKAASPARRSATLLAVARNLHKSGKPKPALENYRKVVADFPGTPAAKEAEAAIRSLTSK